MSRWKTIEVEGVRVVIDLELLDSVPTAEQELRTVIMEMMQRVVFKERPSSDLWKNNQATTKGRHHD